MRFKVDNYVYYLFRDFSAQLDVNLNKYKNVLYLKEGDPKFWNIKKNFKIAPAL